jgi:tetratricopeptide (TPR) repeat protein
MSPRARVFAAVGAAAAAVAGVTVGIAWLQARGPAANAVHPRAGVPPLLFDYLGVRDGAEVSALERGAQLLKQGKRAQAAAVFARYRSLQAQIGQTFAKWPDLAAVEQLAAHHEDSAVMRLHLGLALLWAGRDNDSLTTLQEVGTRFPDSPSAVQAEDVLYARDIPGLPYIIVPATIPTASSLAKQIELAARAAARPDAQAKLAYGALLWQLERRVSARREFAAAARLAPNDPDVLTALGVSRFTKANPTTAFASLGPLTGRFPKAAVVRFHLGLLLLWTRQVAKGTKQLRLVARSQPDSLYGKEARKLLSALVPNGTK